MIDHFISLGLNSLRKLIKAKIDVIITDIVSEIGSAKKMALTGLLVNILGRIRMKGISKITFRSKAKKMDTFAFPSAIKVCWQAI